MIPHSTVHCGAKDSALVSLQCAGLDCVTTRLGEHGTSEVLGVAIQGVVAGGHHVVVS